MGMMRKLTTVAVGFTLLATAISPAMARHNGGWNRGHHRHHDNVDAGDVIAGVAVVGILAAILSSASKNKRVNDDARRDRDEYPSRVGGGADGIDTENAAVDACAKAAEDRVGESASVRDISTVSKSANGWDVEGIVEQRDGWRDRSADRKKFTCSVRYGAVEDVYIEQDVVALR